LEALSAIIGFAALILAVATIATVVEIIAQKNISLEPYTATGHSAKRLIRSVEHLRQWAQRNDFRFLGYYNIHVGFHKVFMAAWQRIDRPTFMCHYVIKVGNKVKRATDIATNFADDVSLTTADTRGAQFAPKPPKAYAQTFSKVDLNRQWNRHIEMENYLIDVGGAQLVNQDIEFEKDIVESARKENQFIRSIPLWYLRGSYWHFVRRYLWHNKSIEKQHRKRMIRLPNEMPGTDVLTAEAIED
jgi:hypothetical protein